MDAESLIINLAALTASFAALIISTFMAFRQVRIARHANQLPVMMELFAQIRASDTYSKEIMLREELPKYDPALGFSNLPEPLRSTAYEVSGYYLMLGYLVMMDIL